MIVMEDSQSVALGDTVDQEKVPLVPTRLSCKTCQCKHFCVNSKALFLILLWNILITTCFSFTIANMNSKTYEFITQFQSYVMFFYGFVALVLVFYPLGGLLGDIKWGRYKVIRRSLIFLTISSPLTFLWLVTSFLTGIGKEMHIIVKIAENVLYCFSLITMLGFIGVFANIIPFAMDQLHDSTAQDSSIFIHWLVWTTNVSQCLFLFTSSILHNFVVKVVPGISLIALISISITFLLILSLCFAHHRQRWFNIEPRNLSPYKLVYRVTRFAFQHKIPVRRSAFTYCEDEQPSRLDLGKEKYGGPFTTEQVEDVKVFYRIMKILFSLGPVFCINFAIFSVLPNYTNHFAGYYVNSSDIALPSTVKYVYLSLVTNVVPSALLVAIIIPLYLCLCQHSIWRCLPTLGILRKMEIGIIINLLILLLMLGVDIAAHQKYEELHCIFSLDLTTSPVFTPLQMMFVLLTLLVLSAFSVFSIHVSYFEFICAQSPHSMKGMLIGLSYAIKGFFSFMGAVLALSFMFTKVSYPSCGFWYYSMNVVITLIAFVVFIFVAKRYQYRERDEPSNERRYAEEYYSNTGNYNSSKQ